MEDEDFKSLPVEERCVHKLWKARVSGYEEVTKLFQQIDDEKSPEFAKYLGLIKKFVTDSNAMGQEKGLEATLAYIENYAHAGKTVGEVMSGIVAKCIAASRTRTRELAQQITLMYIEIEKQETTYEELMKGMDLKNPKIVAACVSAATHGLRDFGSKVVTVKPLVKKIVTLFADRDKGVRDEARLLAVEIYGWIGPVIKSQLTNLQPVQLSELEQAFAKVEGQRKPTASRYLRSQQEKQARMATDVANDNVGSDMHDDSDVCGGPEPLNPYDLADPVDVLSKLPKDFYEKLEEKNWKERKEALETLENLMKTPKLENGDYGDLVRALKKVVQKDSNVICVALAAKCIAATADGLKKRFSTYSLVCIAALLEKFKEKKQNVVLACREAIDAAYNSTNIESILEDVLEALANKNPSVKAETSLFLARAFCKTPPAAMNKKLLKAYTSALIRILNEPDQLVRDCSAEALGTLMKLVGDKAIRSFLAEMEKDQLKMAKVKECCDKAVIVSANIKGGKNKTATPVAAVAPPKIVPKSLAIKTTVKTDVGPPKRRPVTTSASMAGTADGPTSGKAAKSAGGRNRVTSATTAAVTTNVCRVTERELGEDEAAEQMTELLPLCPDLAVAIPAALIDTNWKTRLAAVEQLYGWLQSGHSGSVEVPTQACVKIVCRKPGLKDTHFQVVKGRLDVIKYLALNCSFTNTTMECCVNDIVEKMSDAKNCALVGETLTAMAEATHLSEVSSQAVDFAFAQKNPKVLQETLVWLSVAIKEFGIGNLNARSLIDDAKKALSSNNPAVRQASITLLGSLYLFMGPNLHVFLENEKQALRDQICAEFEKYANEKPPAPIRGVKGGHSTDLDADEQHATAAPSVAVVINPLDLLPKVDISAQITDALLTELADKNWQTRNDALNKIAAIINEAKVIKPSLGELPDALALRLVDSNTKIAQTTLTVCEALAKAMLSAGRQHIRTLFPGFLQGLGDSKAWIRTSSISCINAFAEQCGYKEFFESEMIHDALKSGSPTLRSELWAWLAEVLPKMKSAPKEELLLCVPYLCANLEDRNADVRKNAGDAVLGIMIHLGYEAMAKYTEKLKLSSKPVIQAVLEKARPNLPERPLANRKTMDDKRTLPTAARANVSSVAPKAVAKKIGAVIKPIAVSRKKDEDVDTSPLLLTNNLKAQRTIDEAKLKVLKWNFTTPREEFVDLLKEQMTTAGLNRTLMQNMFHSDFKYHIKTIESLSDDLLDNNQALIMNLDLVLKWFTLRFFDTNPSVLLKGLEYLNAVFTMLSENDYHMLDNEAASFIPYLVVKVGDPKDSVRTAVRILFRHICNVYAISKMFSYIMEGLKSKNARQRAECLDVMGNIIGDYGMCVCLPSESACMKEVAKQISDRDNSVRNAALNCVVQAFYIVGERVYKLVGKISDKDLSLLEERIKRASKQRPTMANAQQVAAKSSIQTMVRPIGKFNAASPTSPNNLNTTVIYTGCAKGDNISGEDGSYEAESGEMCDAGDMGEYDGEADMMADVILPPQVAVEQETPVSGPFQLDEELIRKLDSIRPELPEPQLIKFDLSFLKESVKMPTLEDTRKQLQQSAVKSRSKHQGTSPNSRHIAAIGGSGQELIVQNIITNMASADILAASQAFDQMESILQSHKSMLLLKLEDQFMAAIAAQLKWLFTQDIKANVAVLKQYKALLTVVDSFYANKTLGKNVPMPVLKEVLMQFIRLLIEAKLSECPNGDTFVRVINIHSVKIIERSDHTAVVCCLVQLLGDCLRTNQQERVIDLAMKCLWRVIRIIPTWADDLIFDEILLQIHLFLCEFPSAWWKSREVDTPLRTIKTVIHSMTKMKGAALMLHLSLVPNPNESEMEAFILKLLKNLKLDEVKTVPLKNDAAGNAMNANTLGTAPMPPPRIHRPHPLSKSTHAQLTEIFQKIGSKEETKHGMNLLYDFMQQNPDEDIEPFLQRSSQFFQDYIQKNLKEIERARKEVLRNNTGNNGNIVGNIDRSELLETDLVALKGPEYYRAFLDNFLHVWDEKLKHFYQTPRT